MPASATTEVMRSRISVPPQQEPADTAGSKLSVILDPLWRKPPADHIAATDRPVSGTADVPTGTCPHALVKSPPPALSGRWRAGRDSRLPRPSPRLGPDGRFCLRRIGGR